MHRLLLPFVLVLLGSACTKYPYVALLDGDWAGSANDAAGLAHTMIASFDYDEDEDDYPFTGTVDVDGYLFNVYIAESDKEGAWMELNNPLGVAYLKLADVVVEEETEMKGKWEMNTCYNTDPQGAGPGCLLGGEFSCEMQ
jgi:hypothetical protein